MIVDVKTITTSNLSQYPIVSISVYHCISKYLLFYILNLAMTLCKLDLPSPFPFYGHKVHSVHVFPAFGVVSVDHLGLNFVTHGRYEYKIVIEYRFTEAFHSIETQN